MKKKKKKDKKIKLNTKEVIMNDKPWVEWLQYMFDEEYFIEAHIYRSGYRRRSGSIILEKKHKPAKKSGSPTGTRSHNSR